MPAVLIFTATIIAYVPALSGDFIWNDSDYVTTPALRPLGGLVRIWTEPGVVEQYYPLLHSAFWVQHRLWGDHPFGYHLVNVLLHAGSAVLFGLIVRRLLEETAGRSPQPKPASAGRAAAASHEGSSSAGAGWLAGLLFALHPVQVESVAWITEQKNTLSLAFYLAAALVYLRFDETRRPRLYATAFALFVASMGCKTSTVTLPAALLVVFWWKRGELGWRRDLLPLLPWLILGAAAGLFSSWVEQNYLGARGENFDQPALARVLVAGRAVWFYAGNLLWPARLNFVYPRWTVDVAVWWQWLYPLGVLAVGILFWIWRRRSRGPLAAYLFFVGSLFPVLGFVNLFGARYSWVWDHWQYLPDLGLLALAAAGLTLITQSVAPRRRWPGASATAALALLLGGLTWSHGRMFRNDETLYLTTLARNPGCWMAYNNLGFLWSQQPGRLDNAIAQYQASLALNPDNAEAHNNLGDAWSKIPGRLTEAIAEYEAGLRLNPGRAEAHNNLGNALAQMPGRLEDAIPHFRAALRLDPGYASAHYNLGNVWLQLPGRLNDAVAEYEAALRLNPDHAATHNNLANALAQLDRLNEAITHYEAALRLQPDNVEGWCNLGVSRLQQGNLPAAEKAFREALRLSPDNPFAQRALAAVLQESSGR